MNNTKLKELGLWIGPSADCLAIRAEMKRLHRLFNPKTEQEEVTELTVKIRDKIQKIERFKLLNKRESIKIVNTPSFKTKTKKYKKLKRKLKTKKVRKALSMFLHENKKPSLFKQNCIVINMHGYKSKTSHAKRQRVKRKEERNYIKTCRHQKDNPLCFGQRRFQKRKQNKLNKVS